MANMLFANNCNTTLNGGITAIATSMVVTSATGFPSPTGSQYFYCTLADAATQTTIEIVKVTAVSGTTFTIVRGQDGTTGTIFASGAVVSLRLVAASLNDFPKLDEANTFTGTITFSTPLLATNMVQSTTSTSGYLSNTDWNTFNGKAPSVTFATGSIPFGQGTTTLNQSSAFSWNGQTLLVSKSAGTPYIQISDGTGYLNLGIDTATGNSVFYNTNTFHRFLTGGGSYEAMRIFASTGVSIGNTTDPGATNLSVTGYASAASFRPTSSTVPTNGMFLPLANTLAWAINSAEAMRLNANGRLIIGGTAILGPGKANIYFDGATEDGIDLKNTNAGNAGAFLGFFNSAGGVAGSVSQNGSVGVLYNITSDRRLKSNIEPLKNSGAIIDALLPRTFTWTDDGSDDMGFITDEYQTVFKNAVTGTPNEVDDEGNPIYQQGDFSTSAQIAVLVAEIQSLRARLKAANIA